MRGRNPTPTARHQRGVALVMVLWILVLVTVSTSAFTLMSRMDQLEAHSIMWGTRARLGAEAGLNLAILFLRDPDDTTRWIPDGRPYELVFEDMLLEIKVTDERGKLDINNSQEPALIQLFANGGIEQVEAEFLAAAVADWIDKDDTVRANGAEEGEYLANGYGVGPGNRNFIIVEELLQVIGMSWELFKAIEPGLTVYSDGSTPDPAFAPVEALMSLPEMTREEAVNFVQERHSDDGTGTGVGPTLPNGQVAVARGRGLTYSIEAKATLPNGVWDQIEATIRLGGGQDGKPFRILRWQEGIKH